MASTCDHCKDDSDFTIEKCFFEQGKNTKKVNIQSFHQSYKEIPASKLFEYKHQQLLERQTTIFECFIRYQKNVLHTSSFLLSLQNS